MFQLKKVLPGWLRASLRAAPIQYRKLAWQRRALPQFIVIGAQKSGTTSLYAWLAKHPQLEPSFVKEVHFFDGGLNPANF